MSTFRVWWWYHMLGGDNYWTIVWLCKEFSAVYQETKVSEINLYNATASKTFSLEPSQTSS